MVILGPPLRRGPERALGLGSRPGPQGHPTLGPSRPSQAPPTRAGGRAPSTARWVPPPPFPPLPSSCHPSQVLDTPCSPSCTDPMPYTVAAPTCPLRISLPQAWATPGLASCPGHPPSPPFSPGLPRRLTHISGTLGAASGEQGSGLPSVTPGAPDAQQAPVRTCGKEAPGQVRNGVLGGQVYPPGCVCLPSLPEQTEAQGPASGHTAAAWLAWASGTSALRSPSCWGMSEEHPFPSCSAAGLHSPWGFRFPHHNGGRALSGEASLGPQTGCLALCTRGLPTPGPLGSALPFPGQEMRVPELFHLPAGRTLALPGHVPGRVVGPTQSHLSPPSTMRGEGLQGLHCSPQGLGSESPIVPGAGQGPEREGASPTCPPFLCTSAWPRLTCLQAWGGGVQ